MASDALDILASVTTEVLRASRLEEGLKALTDAALEVTPADHASVRLCGVDRALEPGARSGAGIDAPPPPFQRGQGLMGWVAETGQAVRLGDGRADPRFSLATSRSFPISSVLAVPIAAEGRTLGVLSLSTKERDAFGQRDETLARLLANSAAHALRAAELERMAITDSHTRAYNHRHLLPRLTQEMERAARKREPLSLLLMDLDRFKQVNDRFGHATGDAALRSFVEHVCQLVRNIDVLVRRGGEEFVLILPAADVAAAMGVAERIRADLCAQPLSLSTGVSIHQTVSIGVAVWDGQEGPAALDERADRAMYAAKQAGRNRVLLAASELAIRSVQG